MAKQSYESKAYGRLYQTYGLTKDAFHKLWDDSKGQCNVCGVGLNCKLVPGSYAVDNKRYCVDHCHDSGEVRGLLCNSCNTAVGYLEKLKRADSLQSAFDYLNKPSTGIKNDTRETDKQRQLREMDNAMRLLGFERDSHGRYRMKQYQPRRRNRVASIRERRKQHERTNHENA